MQCKYLWMVVGLFVLSWTSTPSLSTDNNNWEQDHSNQIECPLWTIPTTNNTCLCGNHKIAKCDYKMNSVSLPYCYCMTYNVALNTPVVGHCLFTCQVPNTVPGHSLSCLDHYRVIVTTNDTAEISHNVCSNLGMHRTGQLCGSCEEGYGLPVYSYSVACVECLAYKYNWLKYIAVAYLPLTVFYILIMFFRLSATSGTLNAYIILCQFLTSKTVLVVIMSYHKNNVYLYVASLIHSVWNLDFFRAMYSPFCLHPKLSLLQLLALEYAIAVYPLLLILITYVLATLHYHYSFVVRLWRPFHRCFSLIRKEWEIRASLINAFASFLLLSYVKILNISFDILTPTVLYDINGTRLNTQYLYQNASIEYFGHEHIPYAVLAIIMLLFFNVFPAFLLLFYPCLCFHKCLNYFKLSNHVLHTFMDTFQGQYKTSPYDCRYIAAAYLIIRIINVALLCLTDGEFYLPLVGIVFMVITVALAIVRPYKYSPYNTIEIVLFAILTILAFAYPIHVYSRLLSGKTKEYHLLHLLVGVCLALSIVAYGGGLLLYKIMPRRLIKTLWSKITALKQRYRPTMEERLPHRLEHMDEYTPLLDTP